MEDIDALFKANARKQSEPAAPVSDISKTESGIRGAIEGSTFGLGKYASAAANTTGIPQAIMEGVLGSSDPNLSRWDAVKAALSGPKPTFSQTLESERAANQAAMQANPASYIGGSVVGSLPQALNIASVARNAAPVLGSQALGGAARGAGTGGAYGAIQGAASAENLADLPAATAIGTGLGAVSGAIPGSAAASAKPIPKGFPFKGIAEDVAAGRTGLRPLNEIKKAAEEAEKKSNPLARYLMGAGGLLGGGLKARESDWETDPLNAATETAKHAAYGAVGGKIASGIPFMTEFGKDIIKDIPYAAMRMGRDASTVARGLAQTSLGTAAVATPFTSLKNYLVESRHENPEVQKAADFASQIEESRKAAMQLQSSPAGRAVTNTESPLK